MVFKPQEPSTVITLETDDSSSEDERKNTVADVDYQSQAPASRNCSNRKESKFGQQQDLEPDPNIERESQKILNELTRLSMN